MFVLPKKLKSGDKITVKCETLTKRGVLRIGLVTGYNSPDYSNLACQLEMFLPPANDDQIAITRVQNGNRTTFRAGYAVKFYEGKTFTTEFQMRDSGSLSITIGASLIETVKLMHDMESIRFLTLNGNVRKITALYFQFG